MKYYITVKINELVLQVSTWIVIPPRLCHEEQKAICNIIQFKNIKDNSVFCKGILFRTTYINKV